MCQEHQTAALSLRIILGGTQIYKIAKKIQVAHKKKGREKSYIRETNPSLYIRYFKHPASQAGLKLSLSPPTPSLCTSLITASRIVKSTTE